MLTDRQFFGLAVVLYGVSFLYSVFLLRQGLRRDTWTNYLVLLAAYALHTISIFQRGIEQGRCPMGNLYEVTSLVTWTIVGAYLVIGLWGRIRSFGAFAAPVVFAVSLFALLLPFAFPDEKAWAKAGAAPAVGLAKQAKRGHTPGLAYYLSVAPVETAVELLTCTVNDAVGPDDLLAIFAHQGTAAGLRAPKTIANRSMAPTIHRMRGPRT